MTPSNPLFLMSSHKYWLGREDSNRETLLGTPFLTTGFRLFYCPQLTGLLPHSTHCGGHSVTADKPPTAGRAPRFAGL
jgi:hypothetical protein